MNTRVDQLRALGQSVWLDFIRRSHLLSGEFDRLVREQGVVGVTSNPTIFQQAIAGGDDYDASIRMGVSSGLSGPALCLGGVGVGGIVYGFLTIVRALRQTDYKPVFEDWVWHNVLPLASYAAILVGAGTLRRDPSSALFIEGAAALLLLFIGIHNAWDTVTYLVMRGSSTAPSE